MDAPACAGLRKRLPPGKGKYSWIDLGSGVRGIGFNYITTKQDAGAEVYIDHGKGKNQENPQVFDRLNARKDQIGGSLGWERLEGYRACRIRGAIRGGHRDSEEAWRATHDLMTDAMNRLVGAIRPHLASLRSGIRPGV